MAQDCHGRLASPSTTPRPDRTVCGVLPSRLRRGLPAAALPSTTPRPDHATSSLRGIAGKEAGSRCPPRPPSGEAVVRTAAAAGRRGCRRPLRRSLLLAALNPSLSRETSKTDACPCGRGHGATGRWHAVIVGRPMATVSAGRTRPTKLTGWRTARPPGLATLAGRPRVVFFPEWVTSHTKKSPNQNLGTPSVGHKTDP